MDETGERFVLSDLYRFQARISMHKSDHQAGESQLLKALEIARKQQARLWELRASINLAKLWREQGKVDDAISLLVPIHGSIEEGDCPEEQAMIKELLVTC